MRLFVILLTVLTLQPICADARRVSSYSRTYTVQEGMASNQIYGIVQDASGFIWFGTSNGLSRFDGTRFRNYRTGSGCRLSSDSILDLEIDERDRIWLTLDNGVDIYDPDIDDFRHFDVCTSDGIAVSDRTIKVLRDSGGEIWISTVEQGLFRYSPESGLLTLYRHDPNDDRSISQNYVSVIYESSDGTIWLGTYNQGLCSFSKQTGLFTRYRACPGGLSDNSIDALTEDANGNMWIGTVNRGVDCLDPRTGTFFNADDRGAAGRLHRVHYLEEIAPGELLVCSIVGAEVYRIVENRLVPKQNDGSSFAGGRNRNIYSCLHDREGNIWLGSYYDGVEFWPGCNRFVYYYICAPEHSEPGREVYALCPWRDNTYLIGTEDNGVVQFDLSTGKMRPFRTLRQMDISSCTVYSMLVEGDRLWMAAYPCGVRMIDLKSGATKSWLSDKEQVSSRTFVVFRSSLGRIYAGTAQGLYGYNRSEDRFDLLLECSRILDIEEDRTSGLLWLATAEQGLYSFDARTGAARNYLAQANDRRTLCTNAVNALAVDAAKRLWVGTERGLCRYDGASDGFVRYDGLDLPNNNIKHLVPDGERLWITTGNGLADLNIQTGKLRVYRHTDGLINAMFSHNSGVRSPNGQILLGTADGLCAFSPRDMVAGTSVAPVVITDLLVNGRLMRPGAEGSPLDRSLTRTRSIRLSHEQSFIGLRFIAPGYLASENLRFRFRLDGNNDEESWHVIDDGNTTVYYKLRPGKYLFRMQAAAGADDWGEAETTLAIQIRPHILRSNFALAVYCLSILAGIFFSVNYYRLRIRRRYRENLRQIENEREHELYRTRINFLTSLAHEIRTPLTLIVGPLEYIMRNRKSDDKEAEYLRIIKNSTDRLLDLINQLLDFRKANVEGSLTAHFDRCDLSGLIEDQVEMFRFPAGKKGIEIRKVCPEELSMVSDREMLTKILGNLLSNAVRFARRRILITVVRRDNGIVLEVSDDGAGISEAHRGRVFELFYQAKDDPTETKSEGLGVGLNLVQTLVELLGGTVRITDGPEAEAERAAYTGATFSVFIPDPDASVVSAVTDDTPKEIDGEPVATPPQSERPVVLVVEDNSDMRVFLAELLGREYDVRQAAGGEEALGLFAQHDIDLVISDIMMPGMNGIEFCRRLKEEINTSHIPVILLSAKTDTGSKIEGLEYGADAYIEKPFSPEHLKAQVASLFRRRRELHDIYAKMPVSQIRSMVQSRRDGEFLDACRNVIVTNMSNSNLSVDFLAAEMGLSRTAIFKKLKALTGMTPNDFMKTIRLDEACRMLVEGKYSITEIGFVTGFSSSSYFAKCFVKQFGVLPSEYLQNAEKK